MYKSPRGTVDILPEEQKFWRFIEHKASEISQLYGYQRLDTPVFEDSQLFTRSIGDGTDIVTKEMYIFNDHSDNSLALRPEGTAPVCRAYVEHGMDNRPQPVKLYYFASIFRYERPQAGRFRQHHQFGFEAIGKASAEIDAEVIDMALRYFTALGLKELGLHLNSIGCHTCRPSYLRALQDYYEKHRAVLCNECKIRYERNPLRLLDCKQDTCQTLADSAPKSIEYLCSDCKRHFEMLQDYLQILGLAYQINSRLVRGLDYYTRTVFEVQPPDEGSQSALGGGGRYDNLIQQIGGKPTPALGFGSGIERVILNLKKQNIPVPEIPGARIFIASMGEKPKIEAIRLAAKLRENGIASIVALDTKSLKAQLRQADNYTVDYTIIIGEDEVKNKMLTLKNMQNSVQNTVAASELITTLKNLTATS